MSNNWPSSKLGQLTAIAIGGTPSRDNSRYWASNTDNGFPWVSIADLNKRIIIDTKEQITQAGVLSSNVKLVQAGSVLMSFKLSLGKVAFAGTELYTNEAIASFTCSKELDEAFLFYTLPNLANSAITDVAIKGATLNKKSLHNLIIKYPNKKKQQKIAAILSTIDTAIEKTEALIAKYQQIKAGLMHDLFTRGVLPNGQLRPSREQAQELYQETAIGWIPNDWTVCLMVDLAENKPGSTTIGPFGSNLVASDYRSEGVPIVFVRDVKTSGFVWKSDTYISSTKAIELSAHGVKPGDVMATKMGLPPCISCVYPEWMPSGVITADIIRLTPKSDIHAEWLASAINHDRVIRQVAAITAGVTRPKVTLADFRKIRIACPRYDEQLIISERLTSIQKWINLEKNKVDKFNTQKLGLMQDLLTGKVPVSVEEPEAPHG